MLGWIADDKGPAWQRSALLKGAEVTLLTATMPGGGRYGPRDPQSTSRGVGARNGPGGASVFPSTSPSTRPARQPPLKLSSEPALAKLTSSPPDDLTQRATAVLARLEWPGKSGSAPQAAPLTAEAQTRFNAGRHTHGAICGACHQPDGRGREEIAPPLVGSEFAVGAPASPSSSCSMGRKGPSA